MLSNLGGKKVKLSQIERQLDQILRKLRNQEDEKEIIKIWKKMKHTIHKYQLTNKDPMFTMFLSMSLFNQFNIFISNLVAVRDDEKYETYYNDTLTKLKGYMAVVYNFANALGEDKINYNIFNIGHTSLAMQISKTLREKYQDQDVPVEKEDKLLRVKEQIDIIDEIFMEWFNDVNENVEEFVKKYNELYKNDEEDELMNEHDNTMSLINSLEETMNNDMSLLQHVNNDLSIINDNFQDMDETIDKIKEEEGVNE